MEAGKLCEVNRSRMGDSRLILGEPGNTQSGATNQKLVSVWPRAGREARRVKRRVSWRQKEGFMLVKVGFLGRRWNTQDSVIFSGSRGIKKVSPKRDFDRSKMNYFLAVAGES